MAKRVYISADYDEYSGDREVVDLLNKWGNDNLHKVDFVDMAKVVSGSVADDPDCRICDLKAEFNNQINASSAVIFIVGDKTAYRCAGEACERKIGYDDNCYCTPYKENKGGKVKCKIDRCYDATLSKNFGPINRFSYLRHEFEQAKKTNKQIIILYNSLYDKKSWLPSYMNGYENNARHFWIKNYDGTIVGDYAYIKEVLGFA